MDFKNEGSKPNSKYQSIMKRYFFGVLIFFTALHWNYGQHSDYNSLTDLSYYDQTYKDPYLRQRCKLDLYYPQNSNNFYRCMVPWRGPYQGVQIDSRALKKSRRCCGSS